MADRFDSIAKLSRHPAGRVAIGVGVVALFTVALSALAGPVAHRYPFFCFYPAMILSAWLGGTPAGIAASACSALAVQWFLARGGSSLQVSQVVDYFATVIFFLTGVLVSVVQGRLRDTEEALRRDIAARREVEDELRRSVRREAEANRMKDEFLANLSHELRTPLNVVLGYSRMLSSRPCSDTCVDGPRVARNLQAIERNAAAQMRIIEDLLDVQRIVAGRFNLEYAGCELDRLGQGALESLMPSANAKRLNVRATLEPVLMEADGARLQQVLWNLLANAIKFTPEGGHIGLDMMRDGDEVVIRVQDSGEGIPAAFLPHVFERFRQLDMSATRRHHGMGLGLAIVKHVVEAHGGTVIAESPGEDLGATFTVRLPATPGTVRVS
jgi:signal transduction histidine kinase